MYGIGRWRRGSIGWWGVTLGAVLLVCCHVVFDVLDLDGSDLQNRLFGTAIASSQSAWAKVKRGLPPSPAADVSRHPGALMVQLVPGGRSVAALRHTTPVRIIGFHVRWIRPRAYAGRERHDSRSVDAIPWATARVA